MATLGEYIGAGSDTTKLLLHLNGNSTDSSGNGNNGVDTNITYSQANGKFGQGAGFNGTTSKITTGMTGFPTGAGNRTLSAWFKIAAQPVNNGYPYAIVGYGTNTNGALSTLIYFQTGGVYRIGHSGWNADTYVNQTLSTNTWYHLVATYNGTSVNVYLNGNLIVSENETLNTANSNSIIGGGGDGNWWYNGSIDEVIIENRAWTASEVKKYYTFAKGRFGIN